MEYLKYMDFQEVDVSELPAAMLPGTLHDIQEKSAQLSLTEEFYALCGRKQEKSRFFMESLYHAGTQGLAPGRRQLASVAALRGITLSEQEIRTLAANLEKHGFIQTVPGRRGMQLTDKGRGLCKLL